DPAYPGRSIEIASFEFSLTDVLNVAQTMWSRAKKAQLPNPIYDLITFLRDHDSPEANPVALFTLPRYRRYLDPAFDSFEITAYFIIELLGSNIPFKVYCNECGLFYENPPLRKEEWSYDHGPFASGAGTSWYCPQDHIVFAFQHFRS